jgi:flagellar protein FliO/FliZ
MKAVFLKIFCAAISFVPAMASAADEKPAVAATLTDTSVSANLLQTTFGLFIVLALIAAVAWLFKRFGSYQAGVQGKMKIVGGVSLGARERVVLLQVGDSQLLLGVAPGQIRTLHVLDKPLAADVPAEDAQSFAVRLQAALKRR